MKQSHGIELSKAESCTTAHRSPARAISSCSHATVREPARRGAENERPGLRATAGCG